MGTILLSYQKRSMAAGNLQQMRTLQHRITMQEGWYELRQDIQYYGIDFIIMISFNVIVVVIRVLGC